MVKGGVFYGSIHKQNNKKDKKINIPPQGEVVYL
jgi:hypothetical protein